MNQDRFLVTTQRGPVLRRQIWDGRRPLALDYPARWVLESSRHGLRAHCIAQAREQVQSAKLISLTTQDLNEGATFQADETLVQVHRARTLAPVTQPSDLAIPGIKLYAHLCLGSWIASSLPISTEYVARVEDQMVFKLELQGDRWTMSSLREGLTCQGPLARFTEVSTAQLLQSSVSFGKNKFRFSAIPGDETPIPIILEPLSDQIENRTFKRALLVAALILLLIWGLFSTLDFFNPPKLAQDQNLIPPQYAKVIVERYKRGTKDATPNRLSPQSATEAKVAAGGTSSGGAPGDAGKIAQAARAVGPSKSLETMVSGLVKGGMTSFLNQARGPGHGSGGVGEMLGKTGTSQSTGGPGAGALAVGSVNVRGVGGQGISPVNYRKGDRAAVAGQGKGFVVGGDGNDAQIDEGLTREEVGAVIRKHWNQIRYCYSSAGLRSPAIDTRIVVAFAIDAAGRVAQSGVGAASRREQFLEGCLLRLINTMQFPNPRGGVRVNVDYPFVFRTLGREESSS